MNVDDEHGTTGPVEETPGYVGHIFDDYYSFQDELNAFDGFDFDQYAVLAQEYGDDQREISVDFGAGPQLFHFYASSPSEIVGLIPSVEAILDCPPEQGPGGGAGHIFVLRDGFQLGQIAFHAQVLKAALDKDLRDLSTITPN